MPGHLDVPDLLGLEHRPGGDPGEGAERVEPEVDVGHTFNYPARPAIIPTAAGLRKTTATSRAPGAVTVAGWHACLEPTSPGTRRATRASLLDVTSYSIDLDLTTGDETFGSTTTIEFTCTQPGSETFADLVGATVHEITLNGEPVDVGAYQDSRIALTGLAAENTLVVRADCTYSRTGEGLHRFVDPADDRVYLYSQFEVPDARRVYTTFEQPDLKAPYSFTVTAPKHWKVVSNAPSPQPEPLTTELTGDDKADLALPDHPADVDLHHRAGRRRVPRGAVHLRRQARRDPARSLLPPVARRAPRRRRADQGHRAGLRVLRGGVRLPLPVREVRPAVRAGVQHGRDGERRVRHVPRRVPPAQPPGPRLLRVPRRGDPPRDGAHVVRRPGDHEVVGRPLAQRVVRRVGLLPRRRRGHRVHRGLDRLHQRPQELGLPPGPAAVDPPDRRRQLRPAGRRGQLRRHHLRQGRLGAQAAGGLGRPGELPRGHPGLLPGLRLRQLRVQGPADGAGEVQRPRARVLGPGVAPDLGRQHARAAVRAGRGRRVLVVRRGADRAPRPPDAAPAPAGHRPLRRGRRPARPAYVPGDRRRG